jgi:hypothetical protein
MMTGIEANPSPFLSAITAQYEALRSAMLGEVLSPTARRGLIVFLRQGMWEWTRMLAATATATARPLPPPDKFSTPVEPFEHRVIVRQLASMAMSIHDRRTP